MRRLCVVVCLVTVVLTAGGKSEARGSGISMFKQQHGVALLSRWQQGAHGLLQVGMVAALCTTLACGGVTQAPEVTPVQPTTQYENSIEPDADADTENMLILTKLYGEGFGAARGIPASSIENYEKSKDMLPVQFYDGMMVHYVEDGKDFVRIVDLYDNSVLKVRHMQETDRVVVALETIKGVLVGEHYEYGRRHVSVVAEHLQPLNDNGDSSEEFLASAPEGVTLYGVPDTIFSNDIYVVKIKAFSLPDGALRNFPVNLYFAVAGEHLTTFVPPKPAPQREKNRMIPRNERHLKIASQRLDDDELLLLLDADKEVFSSK